MTNSPPKESPQTRTPSQARGLAVTEALPPVSRGVDAVRHAAQIAEEADEIERYFASLMQRIQGEAPEKPNAPPMVPSRSAASDERSKSPSATLPLAAPCQASDPKPDAAPKTAPPPAYAAAPPRDAIEARPENSPPSPAVQPPGAVQPFRSRPSAESRQEMNVLRDVASLQARGDVEKYVCAKLLRRGFGYSISALTLSVMSAWLAAASIEGGGLLLLASMVALAAALVTAVFSIVAGRRLRARLVRLSGDHPPAFFPMQPTESAHGSG